MFKNNPISKFFKYFFIVLSLSVFIVSCSHSVKSENNGENESGFQSGNGIGNETSSIAVPRNLKVVNGDKKNFVKVTWTANNAPYYWIYYSKTNDVSTAALVTKNATSASSITGYQFLLPEEANGLCYFWIKAADGSNNNSNTSFFSSFQYLNFFYHIPNAPYPVNVSKIGSERKVNLTWSDNEFANYWIYYGRINKTDEAICLTKSATSSDSAGYTISLPDDTGTYVFWVRAANGDNDSFAVSNFSVAQASVRYESEELIAPPRIVVEKSTLGKNNVSVKYVETGAPYYRIYYNTVNEPATATLATKYVRHNLNFYQGEQVALPSTGTYYFWMQAADDTDNFSSTSDYSEAVSYNFTHENLSPPTGLRVQADEEKQNTVRLFWTDNDSRVYFVYHNTKNDPTTAKCITNYGNSTSTQVGYGITLQKNGTNYFWVKSADSPDPDSYTSDFSEVITYEFTNSILSPTGLNVQTGNKTNCVKLTWTPDGSNYYWIYYNNKNETDTAIQATTNATSSDANGYTIVLTQTGTYYFWIVGSDKSYSSSATPSSFSNAVTYEFTNNLSVPTGLKVEAGDDVNTVKVKWDANGSSYYWIYYNTINNSETAKCATQIASSSNAVSGYSITLSSTGTYYFWIKGANGILDNSAASDFSEAASFDFTYESLKPPAGVTVENGDYLNTVKIKWTANDSNYYWIYYNIKDDTRTAKIATQSAESKHATSGYTFSLDSTGTYYFWIKRADSDDADSNTSDFSEVVSFDFTYTQLIPPEGLNVSAVVTSGSLNRQYVKVTWTPNDFRYYWIYYSSTNDPTTATCKTYSANSYEATHGYEFNLPAKGLYYFWIKAADGLVRSYASSDFSEVFEYDGR